MVERCAMRLGSAELDDGLMACCTRASVEARDKEGGKKGGWSIVLGGDVGGWLNNGQRSLKDVLVAG